MKRHNRGRGKYHDDYSECESYGIVHRYCKVQPGRGYIGEREQFHEG